jgi:hypothetical protein
MNVILTDWIPCTTPPVRDGEYDYIYSASDLPNVFKTTCRAEFKHGQWYSLSGGGYRLPGLNHDPENFSWRGVRRWVLALEAQPDPATQGGRLSDAYLMSKSARGVGQFHYMLAKAISFGTEAEARYFARNLRCKDGVTVVMP